MAHATHADAPPRPIARYPALALVLDCTPKGELVGQTLWGRVEFVRYANTSSDGMPQVKGRKDRITAAQLAAVRVEFDRAVRLGKPFANDWTTAPAADDPGTIPLTPLFDLE